MSNRSPASLADFEIMALRSDGFYDARRKSDQSPLLLRKVAPEGGLNDAVRQRFQRVAARAGAFGGAGALKVLFTIEEGEAFHVGVEHFEGRTIAVQVARGKQFTLAESWNIAIKVARIMKRQKQPHGAIVETNILRDDGGEVRMVPDLQCDREGNLKATTASDIRQLALLVNHLAFGGEETIPPAVPGAYRTVLRRMLGADPSSRYPSWSACLEDMELATSGGDAAKKSGMLPAMILTAAALIALLAGVWLWKPSVPATPHTTASAAATPAVSLANLPEAKPEVAKQAVPPPSTGVSSEIVATPEALVEYTRLIASAMKSAAGRDYPGAITALQQWLASHPGAPYQDDVKRQAGRIKLAAAALAALPAHAADVVGLKIDLPDKTQGVIQSLAGGNVETNVQTPFGSVVKSVSVAALPNTSIARMLAAGDAHSGENAAPTFLLGIGDIRDARPLFKTPPDAALTAWADDWEKLIHDTQAVAGLDHVAALLTANDHPGARTELQQVCSTYADSPIVTAGMAGKISAWQQLLAADDAQATAQQSPGIDYPGLPKLTLSSATPIGDPDFTRLAKTTRWIVENGGWAVHRDALNKALIAAASLGSWSQYPDNLERILTLNTPSLMLSQDTVLQEIDPAVFENLANDRHTKDFLAWLFTNPRAISLLAATVKPEDKPQRVLEIWRDCWLADRDGAEKYMALALAVAVDFDDQIGVTPGFNGTKGDSYSTEGDNTYTTNTLDPVGRYRFYRDSETRGALKVSLSDLQPYELVWVVDSSAPESELLWAQQNVRYTRSDWGQAYFSIRYRMDVATTGTQIYDRYTLAEIKERGGICVNQAYYAATTAKANGIPAMSVDGEGDRGAHAWVQWESGINQWQEAGRYADNYAAGTTTDPQTHRTLKEQELYQLTTPQRRSANWALTEQYLRLSTMLANSAQPELARLALDAAVRITPEHLDAWNRLLDAMVAAKASKEDWETAIGRMRTAFQKFPDIIEQIDHRETEYLTASGDATAALSAVERQKVRFLNRDNSRTDLILDSTFQEADLATQAGNLEKAGRIYREALREKGQEAVGFKQVSQHYFDWATKQNQGERAVRDIDQTFERNFKPTGDYFTLTAYQDSLNIVIAMCKQEGMQTDADRLERVSKQVTDQMKQMSDQAKREGAN